MRKFLTVLLVITMAVTVSVAMKFTQSSTNKAATFGVPQIAFSSDPLDYDYYTHHFAFSSIFAKLVSFEKNGEIYPMLASSWSQHDNFKTWKFKIRTDLTYSNGDKILIEDIAINLKRLTFLKNKNNSKSGLLEYLIGFESLKSMKADFPGIQIENNELVLHFVKPMPDLLSKISFGFYGLAHPSLFSHETGEWLDKKKVIASGSYEVTKWDNESYEIELRKSSTFFKQDNQIEKIKFFVFTKIKNAEELRKIDFLVAEKNSLYVNDEFEFIGSEENLKIGYAEVYSAMKKNHPLADLNIRKWLRYKFYSGLSKNNFPITNSFFPLTLKGIKPFPIAEFSNQPQFSKFTVYSHKLGFSSKIQENSEKMGIMDFFKEAYKSLGDSESGINLVLEDRDDFGSYDIVISGTGIEATDYWDTVKFMFLSKEGIKLPDLTGKIKEELKKENPDINFINQEIWDQAVIWPIRHYSSGYWFNKKSNIDYSEMNFNSPAIDFQFLKWKD